MSTLTTLVLPATSAHLVHALFEWGAIACGMQLYRRGQRGASVLQPGRYAVMLGCILGAALGNKLVFWIEFPQLWPTLSGDPAAWLGGQSIVGGLLGGLLGVEAAKKLHHLRGSTGDAFVAPLVAGMALGRIGCFLAGLHDSTYGNPTALPWGVDFGDGIARHPTQLYDIGFVLAWGALLHATRGSTRSRSGLRFKLYLAGYLAWRLAIDGLKPVPYAYLAGLSGIQLVCLLALLCYVPLLARQWRRAPRQDRPFVAANGSAP